MHHLAQKLLRGKVPSAEIIISRVHVETTTPASAIFCCFRPNSDALSYADTVVRSPPAPRIQIHQQANSDETAKSPMTLRTYFSYDSSSSTQKQCRSAVLRIFCLSMAKYSWSGGWKGDYSREGDGHLLRFVVRECTSANKYNNTLQINSHKNINHRENCDWLPVYLPLINSTHLEDTSSAVMLLTLLNMTRGKKHRIKAKKNDTRELYK